MFYDNYLRLCNRRGVSASAAAQEMGLSRAAVTGWAQGNTPRDSTLRRIADYFDVTVDELKEDKEKPADEGGQIANAEAREAFREGGVRVYLDAGNKLSDEDLQDVYEFIRWKQREIGR